MHDKIARCDGLMAESDDDKKKMEYEELKKNEVYKVRDLTFLKLPIKERIETGGGASIAKIGGEVTHVTERESVWVAVGTMSTIRAIYGTVDEQQLREKMSGTITSASGIDVSPDHINPIIYCDKCSSPLPPYAKFCINCGQPVE